MLLELNYDLVKEAQKKDIFGKTIFDQISDPLNDRNEDEYWDTKSNELAQFRR